MTLEAWVNPSTVNANWRDVIYKGNDNFYLKATSSARSTCPGAPRAAAAVSPATRSSAARAPTGSNFAQIATPAGTSYKDTSVSASTSYSYRVRTVDSAGNLSPYSNVATAATGVTVTPGTSVLTFTGTAQFTAQGPGNGSVTWSVDGVAVGNASVGTDTHYIRTIKQETFHATQLFTTIGHRCDRGWWTRRSGLQQQFEQQ